MTKQNNIQFRLALHQEDLEKIMGLSFQFHQESFFNTIPLSTEKQHQVLQQALNRPDRFALLLAEWKGRCCGFLFCSVGEFMLGENDLLTTVLFFYVSSEYRNSFLGGKIATGLLKGVLKWSQNRSVKTVLFHVTTGIDVNRAHRFMRHSGAEFIGGNYAFHLNLKDRETT